MGRTIVKQLDRNLIFEERKTKPDKQVALEQEVTQAQLVHQCWYRQYGIHPNFRLKWPKAKQVKFVQERDLNTENWDNTDHHKVVVPEWFEVVEIWSRPIGAFFDKLWNLWN